MTKAEKNRIATVQEWYAAHTQMKALQERENQLRLQVAAEWFGYDTAQLQKGSKKMPLPGDEANFEFKCQFVVNEKVEQELVQDCLNELAEAGVPAEIRAELFRVKYDLKASVYKILPDNIKLIVDKIMTRSPGMPQVSVESKKSKTSKVKEAFALVGAVTKRGRK